MTKYIYFAKAHVPSSERTDNLEWYKVGYSGNPEARLVNLQVGNHRRVSIEYAFEVRDDYATEAEKFIHDKLSPRIKGRQESIHGEWFCIEPRWLQTIIFELRNRDSEQHPNWGLFGMAEDAGFDDVNKVDLHEWESPDSVGFQWQEE
jgi:hypothetical protein